MSLTPTARREGLVIQELEDETLVYDRERDKAHCLNQTAALVWKYCNGSFTVNEIAERVRIALHEEVDAKIVWLALAELRKKRLLVEPLPSAAKTINDRRPYISRRALAIKFGKGMVVALPLITTIFAPAPAAAGSLSCSNCEPPTAECCPPSCPCTASPSCCSGQCSGGFCT